MWWRRRRAEDGAREAEGGREGRSESERRIGIFASRGEGVTDLYSAQRITTG
jgi:hypothetical protein